MTRLFRLALTASLAAAAAATPDEASAQCSSQCNVAGEHWGGVNRTERVRIGMILTGPSNMKEWRPAYCYWSGSWLFGAFLGDSRSQPGLIDDTSVCGSDQANRIERTSASDSLDCATGHGGGAGLGPSVVLRGFSNDGFEFTISGAAGNDTLTSNEPANICGGNGDDVLVGGNGSQYIAGGSGNDWIDGKGGYDNIRGGSGNDVLRDVDSGGPDKVRGQEDEDCLWVSNTPYALETSCGSQTDGFLGSPSQPLPPECESRMTLTSCCGEAGRHCNFDVEP